ncbi:MAG: hypothetical protein Q7I95_00550 [Thiobacillus sp.]|nr:hypothetical protein [Thiobacillus sp.]
MKTHKLAKWAGLLLVGSLVMYLASDLVLDKDESRPAIEQFLVSNAQVNLRVGTVREAELIKRVSVTASETSKAYRLYSFAVNGETGKATVVVRAERSDVDAAQENFLITEFK